MLTPVYTLQIGFLFKNKQIKMEKGLHLEPELWFRGAQVMHQEQTVYGLVLMVLCEDIILSESVLALGLVKFYGDATGKDLNCFHEGVNLRT